jgi:TolB-like protein/tetratricopeptide (TPR) repeat protein
MADVFVSYARADKARVAPLVAALESRGWSVWWDRAITPGEEFDRTIATELALAKVVLVVWSAVSVESRWVRGEARDGADRGILVPVRIGTASLPIDFRAFHTIDMAQDPGASQQSAYRQIEQAIEILVRRSDEPVVRAPPEPPPTENERVGICILPFTNLGSDPEQQYFSDGIAGDIITELARWHTLTVRSRSASFQYRNSNADPVRVARELDVRYVVEGSVRRIGNRIRVSVQLVDGETGNQMWGEKFDRELSEIFDVQDQVVQIIVGTLVGRVQAMDAERLRRKPPSSLAAYECVQRGNALPWDDPEAAAEATRLFEQAIELDPGYAMAYALLGTMYIGRYRNDPADATAALDEAYALTRRAVELDDGDSTCHSLLAHACLYRRSFDLALQHMRRSIEINPNNAWNRADMGLVLTYVGPAEEALSYLQQARQIDPYFGPGWYWRQKGQAYMVLGEFDNALAAFASIRSHTLRSRAYLAACCAQLGDEAQARVHASEVLSISPEFSTIQFMSKEPFRNPVNAEGLAAGLRAAGLPE